MFELCVSYKFGVIVLNLFLDFNNNQVVGSPPSINTRFVVVWCRTGLPKQVILPHSSSLPPAPSVAPPFHSLLPCDWLARLIASAS